MPSLAAGTAMLSKAVSKPAALNANNGAEQGNHTGRLGILPNELFFHVFQYLDMQSLSRLSRTCVGARHIVHGHLPYQEITKHAKRLLRQLRDARKLASYTADHLFRQVLRSDQCVWCRRQVGNFVYLLTCERVSVKCLTDHAPQSRIPAFLVQARLKLTDENMAALPRVYCPQTRQYFLSLEHVNEAARSATEDFPSCRAALVLIHWEYLYRYFVYLPCRWRQSPAPIVTIQTAS